VTVQNKLLRVE